VDEQTTDRALGLQNKNSKLNLLFLATYGIMNQSNILKVINYEKITRFRKSKTKKRANRFNPR
jgi:hypothetical protein